VTLTFDLELTYKRHRHSSIICATYCHIFADRMATLSLFFDALCGLVTLTFDLLTSDWPASSLDIGNLQVNFILSAAFYSRHRDKHGIVGCTDRRPAVHCTVRPAKGRAAYNNTHCNK